MKKYYTLFIFLLLAGVIAGGCTNSDCQDGYAEYKPVFADLTKLRDDIYYVDETKVGPDHYEKIKLVFRDRKTQYKVVDNKILVNCRTWKNKEVMMNLTARAEDKDWLKAHGWVEEYNKTN